jgi:hypothetical protein
MSRSLMKWQLENRIMLKYHIFAAVKTDVSQDFYRAWESIERISDSDEESLGYYK